MPFLMGHGCGGGGGVIAPSPSSSSSSLLPSASNFVTTAESSSPPSTITTNTLLQKSLLVRNPRITKLNNDWFDANQIRKATATAARNGRLKTNSHFLSASANLHNNHNNHNNNNHHDGEYNNQHDDNFDHHLNRNGGTSKNNVMGIAKRILASEEDLFSMYASSGAASRSMPNLATNTTNSSVTLHPPSNAWPNEAEASNSPSPSSSFQDLYNRQSSSSTNNLPESLEKTIVNTTTLSLDLDPAAAAAAAAASPSPEPLNAKKLFELDNLLFPRLQNKSRSPSVVSISDKGAGGGGEEMITMERVKNRSTLLNHYFDDGKRRVDYVIVFNKPASHNLNPKSDEIIHFEQRNIFEANLRDEGLHLEFTEDVSGAGYVFIKIYAPWNVLTRYAEIMKLKMPMRTMQTTWKMLFDDDEHHSMRFTAAYSKDKEYLFDIPPQKELFFSTAQRAQVVEFILKRKSFSRTQDDVTEFGINKLISDRVYIAAYPIHEGKQNSDYRSPRAQLIQNWASLRMVFKSQPLDDIRKYFGVKIALYFAWLGFYTSMLIPASIVGVLCFLFGSATLNRDIPSREICNGTYDQILMCPQCAHDCNFTRMSDSCFYARTTYLFDNPATVFFAIFMSLWATVYLEMWKRYAAKITYRWDLSNFDAVEEYPRPEYLARLSNVSNRKLNVITRMYEPYIPFWRRQLPYTVLSASVVLLLIMVAIGSVVSIIVYRGTIRGAIRYKRADAPRGVPVSFLQKYSNIVVSSSAAAINLVLILFLNNLYSRIANYLTELEMPRTQSEFDNSLTLKMFLLQFVNYYSSIFYIAFFKGRFIGNPGEFNDESLTQEECATGGCLLELAIQLAIIMVGRQLFSALLELCMPFFQHFYGRWIIYRREDSVKQINVPQWEDDFLLSRWLPTSLFYEYLEMVIQFGFVTIFVSAFPLAPLFALLNNIFEIRLDAQKMITTYRRPVAQRVKNIGIWYRILDTICKLSVITNAMIIAFTTEFVPRFYYYFENGSLHGYINSTLSHFDAKVVNEHLKLGYDPSKLNFCVYPDYREPPWVEEARRYKFTSYYWRLLAVRLSFVVVFENVIATVTSLMRWVIPDVPQQLRQQMRQHAYLTNELILQQEFQRAKELSEERKVQRKRQATQKLEKKVITRITAGMAAPGIGAGVTAAAAAAASSGVMVRVFDETGGATSDLSSQQPDSIDSTTLHSVIQFAASSSSAAIAESEFEENEENGGEGAEEAEAAENPIMNSGIQPTATPTIVTTLSEDSIINSTAAGAAAKNGIIRSGSAISDTNSCADDFDDAASTVSIDRHDYLRVAPNLIANSHHHFLRDATSHDRLIDDLEEDSIYE